MARMRPTHTSLLVFLRMEHPYPGNQRDAGGEPTSALARVGESLQMDRVGDVVKPNWSIRRTPGSVNPDPGDSDSDRGRLDRPTCERRPAANSTTRSRP